MPTSRKTTKAAMAAAAAMPPIPKELIVQFVTGPMSAQAVNAASMAFKKALIERALGAELRISVIVDGCFSLIVDGETAASKGRWGSAQALGLNVAQSSTISLKRAAVGRALGSVSGSV